MFPLIPNLFMRIPLQCIFFVCPSKLGTVGHGFWAVVRYAGQMSGATDSLASVWLKEWLNQHELSAVCITL
uniref:Uncharacterized protein n=1 Tax=Gopherus agassizii TaxID=38772 RepID=A0A452GQ47_9SAUR